MSVFKNIILFSIFLILITRGLPTLAQDTKKKDEEVKLSEINWDEESEANEESPKTTGLGNINWDEEIDEDTGTKTEGIGDINWDEGEFIDDQTPTTLPVKTVEIEPFSHWFNGMLFMLYLFGCFGTCYFTRNKAIALKTPPEILIILHTFWPLELILMPFFRKK